jgi:Rieske Fe-S protein
VEPREPGAPPPVHDDQPHLPPPTLWPVGFAAGGATILIGLVVNPLIVSSTGGAIAIVFAFLWIRDATAELRGKPIVVEPEQRRREAGVGDAPALPADVGGPGMPPPEPGERFPRSRFLEASTLGLGGLIGGLVTLPAVGFAILPSFVGQESHSVDLGPIADYPAGDWYIATFVSDPSQGEVSRRTAYVRNNGLLDAQPSFTIISNRCSHLGCPVQANGPMLGKRKTEHGANGAVRLVPVQPAGFGCPCHGSQFDTEGNRTAGPAVRALDRYEYSIRKGRLWLGKTYSVSTVQGQGAQAVIHKYVLAGPGEHVDGPEQWFYPVQPPTH